MVRRQRLAAEHVEDGSRHLAARRRRKQIALNEMGAQAAIDDGGAVRQRGEQPRIENVLGLLRQRQQADQISLRASRRAARRCRGGQAMP